jgi:transcriptional regulator with XRE-family HTH domain
MRALGALHERRRELSALGRAVREARERQGMTRAELAKKAGLRGWRVKAIEAGWHDPRFDVLFDLREGLGVPLTILLRRAEEVEEDAGGEA